MSFIINASRYSGSGYVISNSCRFNDDDSAKMSITPAGNGATTKGTVSVWVKRCNLGTVQIIIDAGNTEDTLQFTAGDKIEVYFNSGTQTLVTTQVFRDPTAWYHIVYRVDTTAATSDRLRLYVNGVEITAFDTETQPAEDAVFVGFFLAANLHTIGTRAVAKPLDAYLAEFVLIDGTSYGPDSFGETDANGNWVPIDPSALAFGTNGAWFDFGDSANLGNDANGGTDWTESGLAANDQTTDSPTDDADNDVGNYATMNVLSRSHSGITYSDGNLTLTQAAIGWYFSKSSIPIPSTGKWGFKATGGADVFALRVGVCQESASTTSVNTDSNNFMWKYWDQAASDLWDGTSNPASGIALAAGNELEVLVDMDASPKTVRWRYNTGSGWTDLVTKDFAMDAADTSDIYFMVATFACSCSVDYGQLGWTSSVADYLPLHTGNLAAPAVTDPDDGFIQVTDTEANIVATLEAAHSFTTYMEIFKNRDATEEWVVKFSDDTGNFMPLNDVTEKATFPTLAGSNAWLGMAFNMSASYGMYTTTVVHTNTVNTDQAHGLGSGDKMAIVKRESAGGGGWYVAHPELTSASYNILINTTAQEQNTTVYAAVDGTNVTVNAAAPSGTYRVIVFEEIEGFSNFLNYTGATGLPFVHTGFRPAMCITMERTTTHNNELRTIISATYNEMNTNVLNCDTTAAETDSAGHVDFLSNGIKMREASLAPNNAESYIGIAFADHPFGGSGVSQARSR